VIWAGTDDGLVWRTGDGGRHWANVTPPGLEAWAKISSIDASPFDTSSAYVAVNRFRLDEQRPQLFRTHDRGKTWTAIDRGIEAAPTNVVRADPARRGLLYAGTERGVWLSSDDGGNWSSLRLNLPATSVRDLVVHGDDLVIGTHGRGFWILDDIAPLRRPEALRVAVPTLLAPAPAWRVPRDTNTDTPLPRDEPFAANPPSGAMIDYVLPHEATNVTLTIVDAHGRTVRRLASDDPVEPVDPASLEVPAWWIAPPRRPSASAGAHRFIWDLRAAAPRTGMTGPTIAAIPGDTPLEPEGPTVPPGRYGVIFDAEGNAAAGRFAAHVAGTLVVRQDPRTSVSAADLQAQYALATAIAREADAAFAAGLRVRQRNLDLFRRLARSNAQLARLLGAVQTGDGAPTPVQSAAFRARSAELAALLREASSR
jgi:hypothetical protein